MRLPMREHRVPAAAGALGATDVLIGGKPERTTRSASMDRPGRRIRARQDARRILGEVAKGADPVADKIRRSYGNHGGRAMPAISRRPRGGCGVAGRTVGWLSNRSQLRPPFRAQSRPLLGLIELRGMAFAGVGRLWVRGLPERPSRVWRRQATYP